LEVLSVRLLCYYNPYYLLKSAGETPPPISSMAFSRSSRVRTNIKARPRGSTLSLRDKDELKRKCLERVRTQRQSLMARLRRRRSTSAWMEEVSEEGFPEGLGGRNDSEWTSAKAQSSTAREILEYELQNYDPMVKERAVGYESGGSKQSGASPGHRSMFEGLFGETSRRATGLMEMEETAYRDVCGIDLSQDKGNSCPSKRRWVGSGASGCEGVGIGADMPRDAGEVAEGAAGNANLLDDDFCETARLLSTDEYEEMMRYIEEALREEGTQAEDEVYFIDHTAPRSTYVPCFLVLFALIETSRRSYFLIFYFGGQSTSGEERLIIGFSVLPGLFTVTVTLTPSPTRAP
ncbi:unnamed protein product, partial [Discosporangium mesarthrocarpum]